MRTRVAVGLVGLALAACDGDVTGAGATEGAGGHGVGGFGGATAGTGGAHAGGGATTGAGGQGGATTGAGGHGGATTTGAGGQGGAGLPTGAIEIGFWCGPPKAELTDARFAEIAAAGFTFVANACDGATFEPGYNGAMLALAGQHGLRAIVSDARAGQAVAGQSVDASLDGLVKDYAGAPALYGYHLVDEPGVPAFGAIAAVVAGLRARDPAHPGVVNLLPDYATPGQLGAPDYPAYVGAFLDTVKPAVFTYDHYNFLADGSDGPTFFANLAAVRAASIAHGVPFGQYIQAISYVGHRATTGPEKRWAALHTLAYGGTGVMYFTYWTPPQTQEQFGSGIVAADGALTPQYAEVSDINRSLAAMGRYLAAATSTGVFHNGPLAAGTAPRAPGAIAYVPSAAPWTVGLFSVGADAYALVVNRDHAGATESDVILATADGAPEVLDVASGAFVPAQVAPDPRGARVHLALAPGDGALFHLRGPLPAGPPGAEAYFGTVRADAGWLDVVDASFGTARLRPAGWDDCPAGTVNVGKDFQSYGFWLCARQDLAARRFFVGNVVADAGHGWILEKGTATSAGGAGWDQCPIGALLGHRFESNGFWVCME